MKIVILDGYTANPGDLSWDGLKEYLSFILEQRRKMLYHVLKMQKSS